MRLALGGGETMCGEGLTGSPDAHPQNTVVKTDLRIVSLKAVHKSCLTKVFQIL